MSELRNQDPTPRRLAQARARGDVAFSADLMSASVLAVLCAFSHYAAPGVARALQEFTRESLGAGGLLGLARFGAQAWPLALGLLALPSAAFLAIGLQRGFALRFGAPEPAPEPTLSERLSNAFGRGALREGAIGWLKLSALACLLGWSLRASLPGLLDAFRRDPAELAPLLRALFEQLGLRAALGLCAIGACDWLLRRQWRLSRLRMSARELAEEQRELEGDPQLARERRARAAAQREHATISQLGAVRLVLCGAGRALALSYLPERDAAPKLCLKGEGALALRIVAHAYALGVPVAYDAQLAHALHRLALGEAIPSAYHASVAAQLTAARREAASP